MPVTLEDIVRLQAGDVMKLPNTKTDSEMTVKIEGRRKFKCRPGLVGSRVSIQLGERIFDVPDELLVTKKEEEEMG